MKRWLVGFCLALAPASAQAAGIDCAKARSPTEKAICATPGLRALDQAISAAYDDALARAPDQRDTLRTDLLQWLKQRDTACALPAPAIPRCLNAQLTARLAALTPPPQPAAPRPTPAIAASPTPSPATPPAAALPPLRTASAAPRPADPAIPTIVPPPGAATVEQASLPATPHAETLLHVTTPGRFTLTAHSPTGATLQLIDMMTGPGEATGVAGAEDGRLDPLLDIGTYKLRVGSAEGATGAVALTISAAHDAAPPAAAPPPGFPLSATLRDGEQRAFWLLVPSDGAVRIEAAGRALADLRLWRDGRELTALTPAGTQVEPATGRPLTDLRLEGKVEPGTYLAVAYGGPSLPWTDNDPAQPFHLRAGPSPALAEGWVGGPMGPFGSEVYSVPPRTGLLRLTLPAAASAALQAGTATATIERKSREPTVALHIDAKTTPVVEVRAAAGQAFTLQALEQPPSLGVSGPGTFWVSAVANGAGGDEVPAGVLLERSEFGQIPRIVASTLPEVGPGTAWHTRFNIRGPTHLLVHNTAAGELAVRTAGVDLTPMNRLANRAGNYDKETGYFSLNFVPVPGAMGALDLLVGPPGAPTPTPIPLPRDPVIPLGIQALRPGQSLFLSGSSAPGLELGLSARPIPVALAEGPLTVTQAPGAVLSIPIKLAPGGTLAVSEVGGAPIPFGLDDAAAGASTVLLPLSDHARSVVLAWRRTTTPAPIPPPPPPGRVASIAAGTPAWLNLAADETRGYSLTVPDGGLYRVETLGRLHTAGRMATAFIPRLNEADANGAGQNMLLQQILHAGRYRVDVTAKASAGHLGLLATPAPVLHGATLVPGGSVRATLPAGSAATFPLLATGPGEHYRLEVSALGDPWQGRIEDAQGWPMAQTGPLDNTEPTLPAAAYRLVVSPAAVTRQVVARLTAIVPAPEITGHGPHALPFDAQQAATWREPDGHEPRTPDRWTFALAGQAKLAIKLTDGMTGDLFRDGDAAPIAHVNGSYEGRAEAGAYHLDVSSLGRNDRFAYRLRLGSEQIQPGVAKTVHLPAIIPFALATPRVASLTTFGNTPLKAVLRQADGRVVARYGARTDDWNIAASRLLDAGSYTLELAAATPPGLSAVTPLAAPTAPDDTDQPTDGSNSSDSSDNSSDSPDTQAAQSAQASPDATADRDAPQTPDSDDANTGPAVAVTLTLPQTLPATPAPATSTEIAGAGVHLFTLPASAPGTLLVAQATSTAPLMLSLERQTGPDWRVVALDEGRTATVAVPSNGGAWRVQAWTVDGGTEPLHVAARATDLPPQPSGSSALTPLDGMPAPVAAAHIGLDAASPVSLQGSAGLSAGGWPGQALAAVAGPVLPEGRDLWLLASAPGPVALQPLPLTGTQALLVPAGQMAQLPVATAAPGHLALWRAEGGFGQPGLGAAAGVAGSSVVARADAPVTLRRATGDGPLRVALTRLDLALQPPRTLDAPLAATLPPGAALPVTLPPGDKLLQIDAGAGVAVLADGSATWSGIAPLSRTLTGRWTDLLLVNTETAPVPASLTWQPAPATAPLRPGALLKRFYGAAGSFELPFDAGTGGRLGTAGATMTTLTADGAITRGTEATVAGAGRVVVEHGVGPLALWMATDAASPWPAAVAQPVQAPARLTLSGEAMALAFDQPTPSLLHVSTTAPVIAALTQAGRTDPPRLFPAGAELHLMLAAGPSELRLYSPTDGPLTGSLALSSDPILPIAEGLGAPTVVAPGGSAAFGFTLARAATIGVGLRAEPSAVSVRLLDSTGASKGEGVAQRLDLPAGRYVIEAQVPPDTSPTLLRPAVVGIAPRGSGPPPDVAQHYLELVGLKPQGSTP